jgi:DNA-binding response OmpR family regulator
MKLTFFRKTIRNCLVQIASPTVSFRIPEEKPSSKSYDLVILDILCYDHWMSLRKDLLYLFPNTPIILLTTSFEKRKVLPTLNGQCITMVVKPLKLRMLLEATLSTFVSNSHMEMDGIPKNSPLMNGITKRNLFPKPNQFPGLKV